jgi:hypothetical protein
MLTINSSPSAIAESMAKRLIDDINGICDGYQSKSALHTRQLFIQRVQLAMNRERSLYLRKLDTLTTPLPSWSTIKRKQVIIPYHNTKIVSMSVMLSGCQ